MKFLLFFFLPLFISLSATAQAHGDFEELKGRDPGEIIYKGQCTFDDLQKGFSWMKNAAAYTPDSTAIAFLKKNLPAYDLIIFLGTWCEDSQHLIPELYSTLLAAGYPMERITMYGVDRNKEAKNVEHRLYNIEKVPTIILSKNGVMKGRIVETVKKNMEADLVALVQKAKD